MGSLARIWTHSSGVNVHNALIVPCHLSFVALHLPLHVALLSKLCIFLRCATAISPPGQARSPLPPPSTIGFPSNSPQITPQTRCLQKHSAALFGLMFCPKNAHLCTFKPFKWHKFVVIWSRHSLHLSEGTCYVAPDNIEVEPSTTMVVLLTSTLRNRC
jgi:hypothetical protein